MWNRTHMLPEPFQYLWRLETAGDRPASVYHEGARPRQAGLQRSFLLLTISINRAFF
ncbi:hypothetical protein [Alkalicoccus daliensis]|uniref:hypothetical protein n=1 Tax=Alkalicoccus daliensis TaxID=745820 RepID=UPI001AEC8BBD|nr:hypothetical protein [Alkalicoccus daliensis]